MTLSFDAIILAAGKGTRMKSDIVKVAHNVAGKPVVHYVIEAVQRLQATKTYLIVGHQADRLQAMTPHANITYVSQLEQLGTGHAVMQVIPHINDQSADHIIILAGDCPLIEDDTLKTLLTAHSDSGAAGTILTTCLNEPASYGRILHDKAKNVTAIREAKDCSEKELLIKEINSGVYCFKRDLLISALSKITTNNKQKEYYLTDVIQILKDEGEFIRSYCTPNPDEVIGINTRMDLAKCNQVLYQKNNHIHMVNGVSIIDPTNTYIESDVTIGQDTIINPGTIITGTTTIGSGCTIGANSVITNATVADNTDVSPLSNLTK
ncbi:NTP transferase domain-containing protein [bacterium]|jgi:bifunctional UDP-N-acetylglucosamine pyrophosphorylase / glucosamine-1-phosphate N-acetyltransferase|nr:NTP transferase domain-containing protein [bacterium]